MGNGHRSTHKMGTRGRWGYCQACCIWNRAKYFLAGASHLNTAGCFYSISSLHFFRCKPDTCQYIPKLWGTHIQLSEWSHWSLCHHVEVRGRHLSDWKGLMQHSSLQRHSLLLYLQILTLSLQFGWKRVNNLKWVFRTFFKNSTNEKSICLRSFITLSKC